MKVLVDIFPAHLAVVSADFTDDVTSLTSAPATEGAHYIATTRVVVTDELIVVAQDSPDGAQIIFREKYTEFLPPMHKKGDYRVVTETGKMLAFKKDTNCGCGSRLRSWNAYKTITSMRD
jgi:hypothetical protein